MRQVLEQFGAEYKADAEEERLFIPIMCALPTTSGDPGVVVFCCEPGPVIANILELS